MRFLYWLAVAGVLLAAPLTVGCSAGGPGIVSDTDVAPPATYDPQSAAVIFLPGLLATELGAGPTGQTPTNLWPGEISGLDWSLNFPALGMVSTLDPSGVLRTWTTSSEDYPRGAGSVPQGAGTVAQYEPTPLQPLWCLPEKAGQVQPAADCGVPDASDTYRTFGYELQQAAAAAGRGQQVVFYPWDWRRPPSEQVAAFHQQVLASTRGGVKVTIVAHSFGNVFFREWVRYVESNGQQAGDYCGRFVSVAGPWWGVATAWEHPAFGSLQPTKASEALALLIGREKVRTVFASSPGIYDILPTRAFDEFISTVVGRPGEHWLAAPRNGVSEWIPYDGIADVVDEQLSVSPQPDAFPPLSREFYERAVARMPGVGFDKSGVRDWIGVVGSGLDTAGQIASGTLEWPDGSTDGEAGFSVRPYRLRYVTGDGNVPVFSAIQGSDPQNPPGDDVDFYFTCGIAHTALMSNSDVLAQVIPYLLGDSELTYGGVFSTTPSALGACP